jgi:O-antigen ligase
MIIRLMVLVLLSLYFVKGLRAARLSCPRVHIGPALLAYLGLACLSTIGSPYANQSIQWLIVLMSYAGLLYLLVYFIDEWDHVVKLLVVLVGTGFVESVTALSQADWFGSIRATGTFFNPNFLAAYLTAVATVLLGYLCYSRSPWRRRRGVWTELIQYLIVVAGLVVVLLALVSTGSRGGMLAMLVGATLVVGLRFGRRGLLVLVLFFGALLLIASPLRDRLQAEHVSNPVGYARWHIWHSSLQVMKEEPFGVGLGLYQYLSPRYAFPVEGQITRYGKLAKTAHNEYLHMGVELGLVSIAIFCWGVVGLARQAGAALRGRLTRWQRGIVVGTGGAVTAILVQAAVDSTLHAPAVAVVLTLCAGILLSLRKLCFESSVAARPDRSSRLRSGRPGSAWPGPERRPESWCV